MRADRTVIVIGAFLFVVGLAVAWNGYLYIQIERGWSMMIAGTVGFSTGLLLAALGLILRELRAISSSAARAALLLAKAKSAGLPEIAAPAPAAPPAEPEPAQEAQAELQSEPQVEPQAETEWEPQWELEQALAAEALKVAPKQELAPAPALSAQQEESRVEPRVEKQERPLAWMMRPSAAAGAPAEPESREEDQSAAEFKTPLANESGDWLYKTISGPVAGVHPAPAEPPATETAAAEPHPLEPETPEASDDPTPLHDVHEAPAPHEAEAEPALAGHETQPGEPSENEARPEVIGHYDAHGAHYTMYADGSIDAETAHGVYRFGSMEELKRFIEGEG